MISQAKGQYLVKQILQYEVRDGIQYFLVFWGSRYGKQSTTWEPITNLTFLKTKQHYQYYLQLKNELNYTPVPQRKYSKARKNQGTKPKSGNKIKSFQKEFKERQPEKEDYYVSEQIIQEKKQRSFKFPFEEVNQRKMNERKAKQKMEMEAEEEVNSPRPEELIKSENDDISMPLESQKDDSKKYKKTRSSYLKNSNVKSSKSKSIFKVNQKEMSYKVKQDGIQKELTPCTMELDIPRTQMPFAGDKLVDIIKPVLQPNNTLAYQVLLSQPTQSPGRRKMRSYIIAHEIVKLVWPKMLAEYLIKRITVNNNSQEPTVEMKSEE